MSSFACLDIFVYRLAVVDVVDVVDVVVAGSTWAAGRGGDNEPSGATRATATN